MNTISEQLKSVNDERDKDVAKHPELPWFIPLQALFIPEKSSPLQMFAYSPASLCCQSQQTASSAQPLLSTSYPGVLPHPTLSAPLAD